MGAVSFLEFLSEMVGYAFMQRAFVAGLCVGVVAPLVGSFLVHRRMALIGETLAHTAFAGVAVGLFLGATLNLPISPYLAALVIAVIAALLIQVLAEHTDVYGDVALAIILAGGFALGTVVISLTDGGIAVGINQYIFGSLSTITRSDVRLLVLLSVVVVATILLLYKQFVYLTFDETSARVAGIDVTNANRLLVALTALVVVGAMQMMGVILVAAMLVIPVAAATQVAGSFRQSVLLSIVVAEVAVLAGIVIAFAYGTAASGTIVLIAIGAYVTASALSHVGVAR